MTALDILNAYLQDDVGRVSEEQKAMFINIAKGVVFVALPSYKVVPLTKAQDIGVSYYLLPEDWDNNYSFIKRIFDVEGIELPYEIVYVDMSPYIYVPIVDDEEIYCEYSYVPETLTPIQETLVGIYATYLALQELANFYLQTVDPTLSADTVNYQRKAEQYSARADKIKEVFENLLREFKRWT